jgi:hypothetical protein
MSRKPSDPFWAVRGVHRGDDVCLVVEAPTPVAAECFATKRGIDVAIVTQATADETLVAKAAGRLSRYTPEARLTCFGRPVPHLQAAILVICGLATVVLDLHAQKIPLRLHW